MAFIIVGKPTQFSGLVPRTCRSKSGDFARNRNNMAAVKEADSLNAIDLCDEHSTDLAQNELNTDTRKVKYSITKDRFLFNCASLVFS